MSYPSEPTAVLKEICKVSGARWAAWMACSEGVWSMTMQFGLSKARQASLLSFIYEPTITAWLAGAFSSGRTRSRQTGGFSTALGCQRIFAFPNLSCRTVLLIGVDQLEKAAEGYFRILALQPPQAAAPEPVFDQPPSGENSIIPPGMPLEVSYDPEAALGKVLEFLRGNIPSEAAFLAIRSGDFFRIEAAWNCPDAIQGTDISIHENESLAEMAQTFQGVILNGPISITGHKVEPLKTTCLSWMGVPILVGQRVIGLLAFISTQPQAFSSEALQHAMAQTNRVAYIVENAIVFAEAARYLQQLALLNELASAASLGLDTHEVASRVVQRLSRTFHTDLAGVFLLSADGQTLREYGAEAKEEHALVIPVDTSLVGYAVEKGLPLRLGDLQAIRFGALEGQTGEISNVIQQRNPYIVSRQALRSTLAVPLKYRGRIIGALALESSEINAFSQQDEQLLVVIASHLAGLFENMRLNEEMRERAQKLQDSVRQLQAVRETALDIAADLELEALLKRVVHRARELVGAKGAELGMLDETEEYVHIWVSDTPWNFAQGEKMPLMAGVAGRVVAFGEPLVITDYNNWNGRLHPEKEAPFRTVAGVPLKYQGKVIGALTIIDDRPDWTFRAEDLQMLELLAPQVTVWIRNARLYQELQERIKAQRLAENRLIRSARLAAVGEMAAGVAHELNNPLTTVTGFVELVLDELPADSPHRSDLELVLRESQRARGVVRRMLDFSRPVENQRTNADINELVSDVLTLVNHLVRTGGVEMAIELWDDLPWISIDSGEIKQVLLNLVHNAIQAMPYGGSLHIKTAPVRHEGRKWVSISVRDTGEGIAPENMDKIFEPFFTTRPAGKGTGLGLSVSYGIVNDHGGFIEVESQLGTGSCFTIYLPVENAEGLNG